MSNLASIAVDALIVLAVWLVLAVVVGVPLARWLLRYMHSETYSVPPPPPLPRGETSRLILDSLAMMEN